MENVVAIGLGLASTLAMPIVMQYEGIKARYVSCILPNEHPDAFKLMACVERRFGITIENIGTGKTPIDVFREQNFIGNTMHDNCSRVLKREVMAAFMKREYPMGANIYVGIGADEIDREMAIRRNWVKAGYNAVFPLIDRPYINKTSLMALCEGLFGFIPKLYTDGFKHNNCHGACIKAGKKQWKLLLDLYPDVYAEWEKCELDVRASTGKEIGILRETRKGVKRYITLKEFRLSKEEILPDEAETGCSHCEAI